MKQIIKIIVVLAIIAAGAKLASAMPAYVTTFNSTYPAAAATLGQCKLCHINPAGGGTRNGYGNAFLAAGHSFTAIESLDSDGDGYTNIVEIQALTWPGDATSHPTATPPPTACTSFTYTLGACQSNNTAPVLSYIGVPAGCSGGATPATTQPCTYVPPTPTACTSYIYTLGACQSNGTAPVTSYTGVPAGCTGGVTPATTQTCTYVPPAPGPVAMKVSMGAFRNGTWYINTMQNGMWNPTGDTTMHFGAAGDMPVMGNWDGSGTKKIGVFRNGMWYLDYPGTGTWVGCGAPADPTKDACMTFGTAGDIPVAGDWNGSGKMSIGVFRNGMWYLDYPGTGTWVGCGAPADPTKDACIPFGTAGDIPVVGDWNGTGKMKIGVFRNGNWYLDINGNNAWDPGVDSVMSFGAAGDTPVVGDWNGTGTIKIGVVRNGVWYVDMVGNGTWTPGVDIPMSFGIAGDMFIVK